MGTPFAGALFDGCVMQCTFFIWYSLRNVFNTWLRVASTVAIGWIFGIVGTAENTGHPFILDISHQMPVGSSYRIWFLFQLNNYEYGDEWILLSISGCKRVSLA